jgi:hypothetical protein
VPPSAASRPSGPAEETFPAPAYPRPPVCHPGETGSPAPEVVGVPGALVAPSSWSGQLGPVGVTPRGSGTAGPAGKRGIGASAADLPPLAGGPIG